jgi:lipoprotein-anchoring transpeptidase ErfK/SrfK
VRYAPFKTRESEVDASRTKTSKSPASGLRIGDANDASEREADHVAGEVMSGGTGKLPWSLTSMQLSAPLLRRCACGGSGDTGGECEECRAKREDQKVQRKQSGPGSNEIAPPIVHEVLESPGQPLDKTSRDFFEPRFGHDLSQVRVHADSTAQRSASEVNALAYTVGKHVVLGRSKSGSSVASSRNLLAHELTHTIQQGTQNSYSGVQRQVDEEAGDADEEPGEAHDGDTPVIVSAAPDVGEQERGVDSARDVSDPGLLAQNSPEPMQEGKPVQEKKKQPDPPPKINSIDVDLSSQQMTVHYSDGSTEGRAIASGKGSPGTTDDPCKTQTEDHCTPIGDFKIVSKGNKDTKNPRGDKMAWYVELGGDKVIDNRGIGIHNSQPVGGGPRSHGCVRVGDSAADEAFAKKINKGVDDKTVVHITGKAPTKPWGKKPAKKKASAPKAKP